MILLRIGDANCSDTLANSHPDLLVTSCEELDTDIFFKKRKPTNFFVILRVGFVGTFSLVFVCGRHVRALHFNTSEPVFVFISCDFLSSAM